MANYRNTSVCISVWYLRAYKEMVIVHVTWDTVPYCNYTVKQYTNIKYKWSYMR